MTISRQLRISWITATCATCVVIVAATCQCNSGRIEVPRADEVNRVEVRALEGHVMEKQYDVQEPSSILAVIQFLAQRNNGWGQPQESPAAKCSFALFRDSELLLVVWMGEGWIEARKGHDVAKNNRLRSTSESEIDKLAALIGLDPGKCSRW